MKKNKKGGGEKKSRVPLEANKQRQSRKEEKKQTKQTKNSKKAQVRRSREDNKKLS